MQAAPVFSHTTRLFCVHSFSNNKYNSDYNRDDRRSNILSNILCIYRYHRFFHQLESTAGPEMSSIYSKFGTFLPFFINHHSPTRRRPGCGQPMAPPDVVGWKQALLPSQYPVGPSHPTELYIVPEGTTTITYLPTPTDTTGIRPRNTTSDFHCLFYISTVSVLSATK